ncbi:protein indeterminate-domain 11-like [Trifolium pratense]|uniref:protein indeterminate-domain 11-like n=1 Tax=Trifolium pratense TaxID=57577 RepID=UPI001E6918C2|nr:protein indeterminate-domain 11-like [Trifolium pratense]
MIKGFMFQQPLEEENMSNLTSASGEASANSSGNRNEIGTNYHHQQYLAPSQSTQTHDEPPPPKKRRNLPGNPDPEAEVIALSPKTLMATNRFICEICNKGFQRDQNLQLHKRGHNLPWKLKQRASNEIIRKKVYVCPEPTCVHHDPSRALGDLTGIKKHFCRKHGEKKWKCDKCSKKYAVQSDWKAHSKTCGTREYKCDCGTLFSRRDSFITHRAFCDALAEESSKAIIPPPSPIPQPNSHNMINLQTQDFSLKKEHQNFSFLRQEQEIQIPSWLYQSSNIDISSSNYSRLDQNQIQSLDENPNPRNGPTFPSYHQPSEISPQMSATALLQKAAQMGSTSSSQQQSMIMISGTHKHCHVSVDDNNLSSCEDQIINNFSSSGFDGTSFENTYAKNILNSNHHDHRNDGGVGAGGNDGFTRDFLGLRPLSDSEILNIAGMGNCMNSSNSHREQNQSLKPWQGN